MGIKIRTYLITLLTIAFVSCGNDIKNQQVKKNETQKEAVKKDTVVPQKKVAEFKLTSDNALEFFFNYNKTLKENKVKLTTNLGSFTIKLFDNVPYHKSNFIYLTKKGYFDNTYFHRVVKNFIIQGGNTDLRATSKKRRKIGKYLLPPDTKKGYKHHRGIISMPSSEIENAFKMASPYEFFIVVQKPGAYHLDKEYTPFGKVIEGMNIVDKINSVDTDSGDWPKQNVYILKAEVVK